MDASPIQHWLQRFAVFAALFSLAACATPVRGNLPPASIRIAAWNIAHFGLPGEGCIPRTDGQIAAIRDYVRTLNVDVVSFQEVASQAAAEAVFPPGEWRLFVSRRVYDQPQPQCRQDPTRTMGHMRTGFAVRRHLDATVRPELATLGDTAFGPNEEPHGVDIVLRLGSESVRILSVHLTSGCAREAADAGPSCAALFSQAPALRSWIEAREGAHEAWLIAGDFNRVWSNPDSFWTEALGARQSAVQVISSTTGRVDHLIASRLGRGVALQDAHSPESAVLDHLSDHEPVLGVVRLEAVCSSAPLTDH
jgi:endonuclease/exonuclease/phosphatase family metal-dependent hydrolase